MVSLTAIVLVGAAAYGAYRVLTYQSPEERFGRLMLGDQEYEKSVEAEHEFRRAQEGLDDEQFVDLMEELDEQYLDRLVKTLNDLREGTWERQKVAVGTLSRGPPTSERLARLPASDAAEVSRLFERQVPTLLVQCLDESDPELRWKTARALAEYTAASAIVVPALQSRLDDAHWQVRSECAAAIGAHGRAAYSAGPSLARIAVQDSQSELVRREAIVALGKIGNASPVVIEGLAQIVLSRSDGKIFGRAPRDAVRKACELDPDAASSPLLLEMLGAGRIDNYGHPAANYAVAALIAIGERSVPDLQRALRSDNETLRQNAATCLGRIGTPAKPIAESLAAALRDPSRLVRNSSAYALIAIARSAPEDAATAVSALVTVMEDDSGSPRANAADALAAMGPAAREAVPALTRFAKGSSGDLRIKALEVLRAVGTDSDNVISSILAGYQRATSDKQRREALRTLAEQDGLADHAGALLKILPPALAALDPETRTHAASVAGYLGRAGASLADELTAVMLDRDQTYGSSNPGPYHIYDRNNRARARAAWAPLRDARRETRCPAAPRPAGGRSAGDVRAPLRGRRADRAGGGVAAAARRACRRAGARGGDARRATDCARPRRIGSDFDLEPGRRLEAIASEHAAIAPMFWGPRIGLSEACAILRGWIAARLADAPADARAPAVRSVGRVRGRRGSPPTKLEE